MFSRKLINYLMIVSLQSIYVKSKPDLCLNPSQIDGIAYIDSYKMKWALTKSGFYWLLKQNELPLSQNAIKLPHNFKTGHAIAVKSLYECEDPQNDEFSIIFVELIDQRLQYFTYNIDSGKISEPRDLEKDIIFGKADINYTRKLDALFNGVSGQIFFIQGDKYAEITFEKGCPHTNSFITSNKAISLSNLNIKNPIDSAFFMDSDPSVNESDYDLLYLFKNQIVYEIKLQTKSLMDGKLVPISVKQNTIEDIFNEIIGCKQISETEITTTALKKSSFETTVYNNGIIIVIVVLIVAVLCIWVYIALFCSYSRKAEENQRIIS